MTAIIISNGNINNYSHFEKYFKMCDLIICADGGAAHVRKFGILPHILIGDLDSISENDFTYLKENKVEIIKFPANKDMTDTELAIETALNKGYDEIIMIGSTGTRLDHSLANIFSLKSILDKGAKGLIANEHNEIMLINDSVQLDREDGMKVTLLSIAEESVGVSTKGLEYPLTNATIKLGSSWGVSNEFSSDKAEITVKKGLLLVIKAKD